MILLEETSGATCPAGGRVLIALLGEEMASHESLKNQLQHSGSGKWENWGDVMEGGEIYVDVTFNRQDS